jgi:hypothetical protein
LLSGSTVIATDRLVPSQYPTIQAGIDAAINGDRVIISTGTYSGPGNYNIDFKGKVITVCGTDPYDPCVVGSTVIDCNGNGRGFGFHSGEGSSSVLAGVTITNGYAANGGGIYNTMSSPTISGCVFRGNSADSTDGKGGGIYNYRSRPTVSNCMFTGNSAHYGGGMYNYKSSSDPVLSNCLFIGNDAVAGGAMYNCDRSDPTITNCSFISNSAGPRSDAVGGIRNQGAVSGGCSPTITNCILWGNSDGGGTDESAQIVYYAGGTTKINYCCIEGWGGGLGGTGNFGDDPLLAPDNYHIGLNSPCIGAGDPNGDYNGQVDVDAQPRLMGSLVDIGADEYTDQPVLRVWPLELAFASYLSGPNPGLQILTIRNIGDGTITWDVNEDCLWLEADPNSGESAGEVDEVALTVDISGLAEGTYNCELTTSANGVIGSPQTVAVALDVYEPVIEFAPVQIEFIPAEGERCPDNQQLSIWNGGSGALAWTMIEDCNWLGANPSSGESTGEVDEVALSVDVNGLSAGDYDCLLTVAGEYAPNSPRTIPVTLHVSEPYIKHTPASVEFYETNNHRPGPNQILSISNGGGEILNWQIVEDCNWLSVSPKTGEAADEVDEVVLSVDINDLVPGDYLCELVVSGTGASNSPVVLAVSLRVYPDRFLHVPNQYGTIQEAIDDSNDGYKIVVAIGTYRGDGNRDIDFKGKAITVRSINPNDANVVASTIIDCQGSISDQHRGFYFHSGEGANSVVDGLTITNGWGPFEMGEPFEESVGGAIYCNNGSPTIRNCIITDNMASGPADPFSWVEGMGAGVYCRDANIILDNCLIRDNGALPGWSAPTFPETLGGGGIYVSGGTATIENCTISNNAAGVGGAVIGSGNQINLVNCLISGNIAFWGAAAKVDTNSVITNCTIVYNECTQRDGVVDCTTLADIVIDNCIIWGNIGPRIISGDPEVVYSDIQGGWPGEGNIDADPCFVSGPLGDYYLSQAGAGQVLDSPCVDTGSDLAANLGLDTYTTRADEISDVGIVDMGYHYTASVLLGGADINQDLHVDSLDYCILASYWLQCNEPCDVNWLPGDITENHCVDGNDLKVLLDCWLDCYVGMAGFPMPHDAATGLDPNLTLAWSPGYGSLSHDIYLGTDANAVGNAEHLSSEFMGTVSETDFDPCGLEFSTKYYWRIDEVGLTCTKSGAVWSFTTEDGKASNPDPADGKTAVALDTVLSWTPGLHASLHDVYFGTDYNDVNDADTTDAWLYKGEQLDSVWDPCGLAYSVTYYWRIDEKSPFGTVKGDVWDFTTDDGKASNPDPADGKTTVAPNAVLAWTPGLHASLHHVYFGTDYNDVNDADTTDVLIYKGEHFDSVWDPCGLAYSVTYYWRIDEKSPFGTVRGNVWSFTSAGEPNFYLVGWWQFDEGADGTAYDSAGDNDGILQGDPCWVAGYVGSYALDFDGADDYVEVSADSNLNVQYVTMSAWVKVQGPASNNHVLNRQMTNPGTYLLWVRASDGKWGAMVRLQGSEGTGRIIMSNNAVTGEWTHVCGTYDGDKLELYIDSVPQDDVDDANGTVDADHPGVLTIGAHPTPASYFSGSMDDVRIYNRALTAAEIEQLYP